jgi:hypothetical protein
MEDEPASAAPPVEEEDAPPEVAARPLPIRDAVLRDILASGFSHGTKMAPAALPLSSVLIRAFVSEAWHRATAEAEESGDTEIKEEHLEKVLPQLLLDF